MFISLCRTHYSRPFGLVASLVLHLCSQLVTTNNTSTSSSRQAAPYPTRDEIINNLKPGMPPKDRALFWTAFPRDLWAYRQADALKDEWASAYSLVDMNSGVWNSEELLYFTNYEGTIAEHRTFRRNENQVFAEAAEGRVYLLMPSGTAPHPYSFFWEDEWPVLERSAKITEIVWVDATPLFRGQMPPDPATVTRIWWRQGIALPVSYPGMASASPFRDTSVTILPSSTRAASGSSSLAPPGLARRFHCLRV